MPHSVTLSDLAAALAGVGLSAGDAVAFHTSLSAFGHVEGGADTVIDAVLQTLGPQGTALAPTLTFAERYDPDCPPDFDARTTPSVTGQTPEAFRLRAGAARSLHPTHSWAALGSRMLEYTTGHEFSVSPCDAASPLGKLARDPRGRVLMLGVTLKSCTFFHHCEEMAGAPYHLQPRPTRCWVTAVDGRRFCRDFVLHRWGPEPRDFTKPEAQLLSRGIMRKASCGHAEIRLLRARETADFIIDKLRTDPHYLLA